MVIGYVFIKVAPLYEYSVYTELRDIPDISEIHSLMGPYDIIAKIRAEDGPALGRIILEKIRTISGILDTRTQLADRFPRR